MSALFLVVLTATQSTVCYQSVDSTPGWKQVALPQDAPSLAAPEGVLQFRSDEPVLVIDERPMAAWVGAQHRPGTTLFEFPLSPGAKSVEVRFAQPLRGAKVDATGYDERRQGTALMREQRTGGNTLNLSWGNAEMRTVEIGVHDHFRHEPLVASWKATSQLPASRLALPLAFKMKRSLYYLQPASEGLRLCNEPSRIMTVRPDSPSTTDEPLPTALVKIR